MKEEYEFDFNEILDEFRSGKGFTGKGGLLAPLIKQLIDVNRGVKLGSFS